MIDTLVYDMGNVLVNWDPHALAVAGSSDPADARLLEDAVFGSEDWVKSDMGIMDQAAIYRAAKARLPQRLHGDLKKLCFEWPEWIQPLPGADGFLRRAKAAGLKGYLLSNASNRFPDALAQRFPAFALLDGWVVSAHEGAVKPDPRIFRALLDKYGLQAQRCFFIDDMAANVAGARRVGMDGYVFDGDFDKLARALRAKGVAL